MFNRFASGSKDNWAYAISSDLFYYILIFLSINFAAAYYFVNIWLNVLMGIITLVSTMILLSSFVLNSIKKDKEAVSKIPEAPRVATSSVRFWYNTVIMGALAYFAFSLSYLWISLIVLYGLLSHIVFDISITNINKEKSNA